MVAQLASSTTSGSSSQVRIEALSFEYRGQSFDHAYLPDAQYGLSVSVEFDQKKLAEARDDLYERFGDVLRELAEL